MKRINGEGSIYRAKNGKWIACITVGRNDKGKLIRRQRTADTKQKALAALEQLKSIYTGGAKSLTKETPLSIWLEIWLQTYKKGRIREYTLYNYNIIITRIKNSAIGQIQLYKLQTVQIQQVINELPKALAHRTLMILRSALKQATDEGIILFNAANAAKAPRYVRKEVKTITPEEMRLFVEDAPEPLKIAALIGWGTGARPEEILGLTWDAIDFKAGKMSIFQATNKKVGGEVTIVPPKTVASKRTISLPPALLADLKRYKREQAVYILAHRDTYDNKGFIVTNKHGKPLYSNLYHDRFTRWAKQKGLNITPKTLRHSHATQLFKAGWTPKAIQNRLGHAKVSITMDVYTHLLPEHDREIASFIDTIYPVADTLPS